MARLVALTFLVMLQGSVATTILLKRQTTLSTRQPQDLAIIPTTISLTIGRRF